MEPVLKPAPSSSVDTGQSPLPRSDIQAIREAIHSAGGATMVEIYTHGPTEGPPTGASTAQILITIIGRMSTNPTLGRVNQSTTTTPLLEALRALRESGIIGSTFDKGDQFRPLLSTPSQGSGLRGTWQDRPLRIHHDPHRSPHGNDHRTAEAREGRTAHRDTPHGDDRTTRAETPQEQRLREVIERAVTQYLERVTETSTGTDRPAEQAAVERQATPGFGHQQSPTSVDPDRVPQPSPSIVTPDIRDTLNDSRNDTARLLQQILGADSAPSRPTQRTARGAPTEGSAAPTLSPELSEARVGVNQQVSYLRDALQVTIERTSPQPISASERASTPSQGALLQGDFTRVEAAAHNARPQVTIQSESRAAAEQPRVSAPRGDVTNGSVAPGPLRAAGQPRDEQLTVAHEKASNLLDALSKAAQKILSVEGLRKIEYAAETAVLTAAAALALGVMGSEVVLKELLALSEEILKRLRGEKNPGDGADQEVKDVEQLVRELEEACADRGVETINQPAGLVADIPGILKDNSSGLPLEGIEIDGGALGITFTNARGEFIFRNVPLDEGFAVVARQEGYTFFPNPAIGTVSATTYLTIFGTIRS